MTNLEAHANFAARVDRKIGADDLLPSADHEPDVWPVVAAAAADLSGLLPSCRTGADLDNAVRECGMRILRGEVTRQDFRSATLRIAAALEGLDFDPAAYPLN